MHTYMIEIVNRKIENIFSDSYWVLEEYKRNSVTFLWWVYLISFERVDFYLKTKCVLWNRNASDNRKFQIKDNEGHKDKYLETSRRILSQEMRMYHMKVPYLLLSYDQWQIQKIMDQMSRSKFITNKLRWWSQGPKCWYLSKDLTSRNTYMWSIKSSRINCLKVINKDKAFQK